MITWTLNRQGDTVEHIAHTIGYDLYVFEPLDGDAGHVWILDAADGSEVATGTRSTLSDAKASAVEAYDVEAGEPCPALATA